MREGRGLDKALTRKGFRADPYKAENAHFPPMTLRRHPARTWGPREHRGVATGFSTRFPTDARATPGTLRLATETAITVNFLSGWNGT